MKPIFKAEDFKDADGFTAHPELCALIANTLVSKWLATWTSDDALPEHDLRQRLHAEQKRNVMLANLVEGLRLEVRHLLNSTAPEGLRDKFQLADKLVTESREATERQNGTSESVPGSETRWPDQPDPTHAQL